MQQDKNNKENFNDESLEKDPNINEKFRYKGTQLILIIQMVFCAVIFILAFSLKLIGGPIYESFSSWYKQNLNDSLIMDDSSGPYINAWDSFVENGVIETGKNLRGSIISDSSNKSFSERLKKNMSLSVPLTFPIKDSVVTSNFGRRKDPISKEEKMHNGLDLAAEKNSDIQAALSGVVESYSEGTSYGKCLVIDHGNDIKSLYGHCNEILVQEGSKVNRGDVVAKVGSTGRSTGNHLHFEIMINGEKYDPELFFNGINI